MCSVTTPTLAIRLARTALEDGRFIARHLARKAANQPLSTRRSFTPPNGIPVGDDWAYVEWLGVYVTGRIGSRFRRMMELSGYKSLLSYDKALTAWRAHYQREETCELCKR